ncbi:MAG: hypothetical protein RL701_2966, partial [Pseudomonadota bacterium]
MSASLVASLRAFSVLRPQPTIAQVLSRAERLAGLLGEISQQQPDSAELPTSAERSFGMRMGDDARSI